MVRIPVAGLNLLIRVHRAVFDATRGRAAASLAGMPVLKLTTVGRQSGRSRDTMLTTPVRTDDRIVLVASNGGARRHPAWYLNLQADPLVTVTMAGRRRAMRARTATAAEKAELWGQIVAAYRGYAGYQDRTSRDIPVVILEQAAGPSC